MTTHRCRYCGTKETLQESASDPGVYACHTCINVPTRTCPGCRSHVTAVDLIKVTIGTYRATRCLHCTPAQKVTGL